MQDYTRHLSNWSQWGIQWIEHLRREHRFNRELERHMHKFEEEFTQIGRKAYSLKKSRDEAAIPALVKKAEAVQEQFHQLLRLIQHGNHETQEIQQMTNTPVPARQPTPVPVSRPVPIGKHSLPPLPYDYDALMPYIDEETMRIHHDKLHQKYVDDLNHAEKKLAEARANHDFDLVRHWERELAFNGAGHYLHTIFWNVMSPDGGGEPPGDLSRQITRDFGSLAAFRAQFSQAAEKVEGPGWAILVWSPRAQRLEILQAEKHQNLSQWDVVPLLVLDVWEHSYFLSYKNDRASYVQNWWNLVNWPYVEERYQQARKLRWQPF
ncbi:superoxide dismutase [Brevibacillus ruminantium]|uniref:superoxide dismutase n=1 Tax=Brevibacillus ruminantium TaxID=2950604 RepID=A0ABY4WEI9_9BACL|nr:superoxide dismutase [Brevibacillus ruminantium]USG64180.1 superoxide dismutase [Brevibacillus ruminantium]